MKETTRPAAIETPQKSIRVNTVQRILLETLLLGPQTPKTMMRRKTFEALVEKGLAVELKDGSHEITQLGMEIANGRKMGRKTKLTGAWLMLANHYGGPEELAKKLGCPSQTIGRWARKGVKPSGIARKMVAQLAKESGLPDPFEETGT